ncbi:LPS export ABC transporter periplasmic protein LptC [Candidatus Pelagibacter sp.]|uniref:LPS export ABC transporter periplasmic protein LptC n=1 Tax=Candidatus Pelagibacter sp. TaxID=2024849 RepID=UPI003D0B3C4B
MRFFSIKSLLISSLIFFIVILFFIHYKQKISNNVTSDVQDIESYSINSNIIKDIKYSSKDLKGNQYIIIADEGEIDFKNTDVIFLTKVTAYVNLIKNNETIKITSDFGKYNTINFNTIFSKNVNVDYIDNNLKGNYLDFSMKNNLLIISKNVIYTNPQNILMADVVELNTITKDTKIFMHNLAEKVEVIGKK